MPSLIDIAVVTEPVTVGGVTFEVRGLTAKAIGQILVKFPAIRAAWIKRDVGIEQWFETVPELIPIVIAAGIGKADDPVEIAAAAELSADTQMALLAPVWKLTMPDGIGPFVDRLTSLVGQGNVAAAPTKVRGTK
jgi:hypothetical protein